MTSKDTMEKIMRKSRSTNLVLLAEIEELAKKSRENGAPIWRDLTKRLSKSSSRRAVVNVSKINRYTEKRDVVAVPGKVLGAGRIGHAVTVAAFSFSKEAREKIASAGGRCITLTELASENPKGTNVKILG
ncbi:MAG: 50S ribosomal protein L18e [Candidatus Hydrothermarchaeales archaeon]